MSTYTFPMTAARRPRSLAVEPCAHAYPQAAVMTGFAAAGNDTVKTIVGSANQDRPPRGVPR